MTSAKKIRCGMTCAAAVLLAAETLIGRFADGWVRGSLGDILVVMLIYAVIRVISPTKPDIHTCCGLLPAAVLLFAIIAEGLQAFDIADKLGITDRFLRTLIGTTFSPWDIFCYIIGTIPCWIVEIYLKRNLADERKTK